MASPTTNFGSTVPTFGTGTQAAGTPGVSNSNIVPTLATGPISNTTAATQNPYVPTLNLPGSTTPALSTYNGDYTVAGDFTQTYGQGTGTALINTLAGLGTSTDAAVQATATQSYQQAQKGAASIISGQAASGISRDSSTSALAQGDYWSTWANGLNTTIAGMEYDQENTLLSALMGEGKAHGGDSSWTDSIGDVFGLLSSGAGAVSQGFGVDDNSGLGKTLATMSMFAV